jgi:hypothetical protein
MIVPKFITDHRDATVTAACFLPPCLLRHWLDAAPHSGDFYLRAYGQLFNGVISQMQAFKYVFRPILALDDHWDIDTAGAFFSAPRRVLSFSSCL